VPNLRGRDDQEGRKERKEAEPEARDAKRRNEAEPERQSLVWRKKTTGKVDRREPTTRRVEVVRREPKNGGVIQRC
jgi:hypothetical protein